VTFLDEVLIQVLEEVHARERENPEVHQVLLEMEARQNYLGQGQGRTVVQSQEKYQVYRIEVHCLTVIQKVLLHLLGHWMEDLNYFVEVENLMVEPDRALMSRKALVMRYIEVYSSLADLENYFLAYCLLVSLDLMVEILVQIQNYWHY
jgi:hypothetical protein